VKSRQETVDLPAPGGPLIHRTRTRFSITDMPSCRCVSANLETMPG
jgi:hypothetical protein